MTEVEEAFPEMHTHCRYGANTGQHKAYGNAIRENAHREIITGDRNGVEDLVGIIAPEEFAYWY